MKNFKVIFGIENRYFDKFPLKKKTIETENLISFLVQSRLWCLTATASSLSILELNYASYFKQDPVSSIQDAFCRLQLDYVKINSICI